MKYNTNINISADTSTTLVLKRVKPGTKVLEFGPATGYMTRFMKEELGCQVHCIEIDQEAAEITKCFCEKMIVADIDDMNWGADLEEGYFDHILFADVLEHLKKPWEVLEYATAFLRPGGTIITSIPNAGHNAILMELLEGRFDYRPLGLLDDSHLRFFTRRSIIQLLDKAGLVPLEWVYTKAVPEETEFMQQYELLPDSIEKALKEREDGHIYQFITVSKRKEDIKPGDMVEIEEVNKVEYITPYEKVIKIKDLLTEKEYLLERKETELAKVKEELSNNEIKLDEMTMEVNNLRTALAEKDLIIKVLLDSRSWQVTAPLRWISQRAKKIKGNVLQPLVRWSYKPELIPHSGIAAISKEGEWESLDNDPQFYINGPYPEGWVQLSWKGSSDYPLKMKLYKDRGNGFNELNSQVIGMMPDDKTNKHYSVTLHIEPGIKKMRLDPGDSTGRFFLADFKVTKITRFEVFCRGITLLLTKENSCTFANLISLFKKAWKTLIHEGFRGVWNKSKHFTGSKITPAGNEYEQWIRINRLTEKDKEGIKKNIKDLKLRPLISVILPVYNVEEKWLRRCIESVQEQLYPNWELCIADDASTKPHIKKVLEEYASQDKRIKVVYREKNGHISAASNSALELANGEFIALLDHDDELTPDALYENVVLINEHPDADMIYSDEDKIDDKGKRHSPFFKPDWSPDTFLSQMYTCHLGVYRTELVRQVGGFRVGFEGSQDYDFVLRFTEKTTNIYHIPQILYHWRTIPESTASGTDSKSYAYVAGQKAIQEALDRRGEGGYVEQIPNYPGQYRVHYPLHYNPMVSIIIPTRDMPNYLEKCLDSIFKKTTYLNFEVIVVDNGSTRQQTFDVFTKWEKWQGDRFRVIHLDMPFNYSKLNNEAVKVARGELVLLLNNDTVVSSANWLKEMVGYGIRKSIGAVGAMLLYPDDTVQHAGLILGIVGPANHGHRGVNKNSPGYFGRLLITANYSAVTGACLLVKKALYEEVGGLDENLSVAYNDVDFCLKLLKKGLYNVVLPHIKLVHYESKSRGMEDTSKKQKRLKEEANIMERRWGDLIYNDPFYNPNLTRDREDFSLNI